MVAQHSEIADALFDARIRHRALAEVIDTDLGRDTALALQLAILKRFEARGQPLGGWKMAFSSGRSRDRMGAGFRPFGYVLAERMLASGAEVAHRQIANCKIEPELCLVLSEPLSGPDITSDQARQAVLGVAPAFEINELRLGPNKNDNLLLADGMGNWGIVTGPVVPIPPGAWLPDTRMRLFRDDELIADVTPGAGMDDPFLSLQRCCAVMDGFGLGFQPQQRVIAGSFCHEDVGAPASYRAEFSGIGSVTVKFI